MTDLVYLVGEGTNDIGGLAREPEYQTDDDGFFQPVIRSISGRTVTFKGRQLKTLGREKVKGLSDAWSRKAAQARALAEYERADLVVVAADVDSSAGERASAHEAQKRIDEIREALEAGFQSFEGPPAVPATPCRTIEAWALADATAVREVAGVDEFSLPKPPEELWGKPNDPASNHPKCVLTRIFSGSIGTSDYAAIATAADIDVLEAHCPVSFAPFAAELRAAFGEV